MYTQAVLGRMESKKFPKTGKQFTAKELRKKAVKGIDEGAILAGLRAYQKKREELNVNGSKA